MTFWPTFTANNRMRWLLTRPAGCNHALAKALDSLGCDVDIMPALRIVACEPDNSAAVLQQLPNYTALLFTSRNAVHHFADWVQRYQASWPAVNHLAIGLPTAQALRQYDIEARAPATGFRTEDLLAMPDLDVSAGKRVLLVSGQGGRGLLQPALQKRQISVTRLDVYLRQCNVAFDWPSTGVDGILVTSLDSWRCILARAGRDVRRTVVVVGSERMAQTVAKEARTVVVADSPADDDMLAAVRSVVHDKKET